MAQRPKQLTPNASPAHFWGAEMRARRVDRGLSLEDLGRIIHRDRSYLAKIERGERVASPEIARDCDRALGDDGSLIRLHAMVTAAEGRHRVADAEETQQAGADVVRPGRDVATSGLHVAKSALHVANPSPLLVPGGDSPAPLGVGEEVSVPARLADGRVVFVSVSRRLFLGAVGASAAEVAAERVVPGAGLYRAVGGVSPDLHPVEHFEQLRQVIIDSDNLFGPEQIIPTVTSQVELIRRLRHGVRGGDQSALMAMQAKFAETAGWLYQDYGDFAAAEYWTNRALEWSHGARDHDLTVFILARRAHLAGDMEDAAQALDLGMAAREMAVPGSKLAAVAATYSAHGYALQGDLDDARRGYDEARELLDAVQLDPESPWAAWLDVPYIEVARHRSLAVLGEYRQAAEGFEAAIAALPAGYRRDRGVYLARAARAYAGAEDIEHAAGLGLQALAIGLQTRSGRIMTELAQLGDALDGCQTAQAAEFMEAITDTIGRRTS